MDMLIFCVQDLRNDLFMLRKKDQCMWGCGLNSPAVSSVLCVIEQCVELKLNWNCTKSGCCNQVYAARFCSQLHLSSQFLQFCKFPVYSHEFPLISIYSHWLPWKVSSLENSWNFATIEDTLHWSVTKKNKDVCFVTRKKSISNKCCFELFIY